MLTSTSSRHFCYIVAAVSVLFIAHLPAYARPGPRAAPAPRPGPRPAPIPHVPWSPLPTGGLGVSRRTSASLALIDRQSSPPGSDTLRASEPGGPLQPHSHSSGVSDSYADNLLPEPLAACYNTNSSYQATDRQPTVINKTSPVSNPHCPEKPDLGDESGDATVQPSRSKSAPPPTPGQQNPVPSPLPNPSPTKSGTDPTSASALGPTAPLPAPTPSVDQPTPTTPPNSSGIGTDTSATNTTMPSSAPNATVAGTAGHADSAIRRNRPPAYALGIVPTLVLATAALVAIVILMDWLLLIL
ncbi:hypothetical protein IE81DRAFT_347827 [Ceraceosorus guamensis]|uniref:Uncharacterized protein n=1 Tax=Ceraceosorus guamensis TaxID=1522189 RepID=A0A316VWV8_9BASI|nr:hypothetical protein IE81DRAFT_347827 [Ceraceosorus guamensis]PWN41939.1 hypothetical protein IE81DRAFT_347827 [Ceraceosorus guamensis]